MQTNKDEFLLGRQADNEATVIEIDVTGIEEKFGTDGTWNLLFRRPNEIIGYPVPTSHFVKDGNSIKWTITATETEFAGEGELQLAYSAGNTVKMSRIYIVHILRSLTTGEAPSEIRIWLDEMNELVERAESASAHTAIIGDNGDWYIWDAEAEEYIDSGLTAQGPEGPEGPEGQQGPQGPEGPKGEPGDSNVFIATYGETPYADIADAANSGKAVMCLYRGDSVGFRLYPLANITSTSAVFMVPFDAESINYAQYRQIQVTNQDVYTASTKKIEKQSNRVNALNNSSTNYPTCKAVKDYVDSHAGNSDKIFKRVEDEEGGYTETYVKTNQYDIELRQISEGYGALFDYTTTPKFQRVGEAESEIGAFEFSYKTRQYEDDPIEETKSYLAAVEYNRSSEKIGVDGAFGRLRVESDGVYIYLEDAGDEEERYSVWKKLVLQ